MLATAYKPAVSAADDMNKSFDLEHDEDDDSDRRSIGSSKVGLAWNNLSWRMSIAS
jgi:hypothetical protein